MRSIISIFTFLTLLCTAALAATITSTFESDGDGTMTHYTYLKEPDLQESGYTSGYKAGSMNYFSNGLINYSDTITYDDGLEPSDGNSSVNYTQSVHFEGDKGISEFYGKGFYPSNRAISAWKKIRYDDLSYNKSFGVIHLSGSSRIAGSEESSRLSGSYDLGESYDSSKINVIASVKMGPVLGRSENNFEFEYNATVEDGILEIRDVTGWTNRTGALRVDWERDAVMKGNFTVVNDLVGADLFFPAGGDDDWLSCCIGGDYSKIDPANDYWPNTGTYGTLAPKQVSPSTERTQNCSIVFSPDTGYTTFCRNLSYDSCPTEGCSDFECIYNFESDGGDGKKTPSSEEKASSMQVTKYILYNDSDSMKYKIVVHNSGSTRLEEVSVRDVLPNGMNYNKGNSRIIMAQEDPSAIDPDVFYNPEIAKAFEAGREANATPIDPHPMYRGTSKDVSENPDLNLTWNIEKLESGESAYIYFNVTDISGSTNNFESNRVYVEGTWKYGNETVSESAEADYPIWRKIEKSGPS